MRQKQGVVWRSGGCSTEHTESRRERVKGRGAGGAEGKAEMEKV